MRSVSIDVIIPSVGRPDDLRAAVASVQRSFIEARSSGVDGDVIVVHRDHDLATRDAAVDCGARVVATSLPGLAAAMRTGAEASNAEVIAFMDDDARMRLDWHSAVAPHYRDARIGGVGGADIQPDGYPVRVSQPMIGRIDRWGRVLGGHHQAVGGPREVDHLKGVNCSFRRDAFLSLKYQDLIAGTGAQARNEFVTSLVVGARGLRIMLEPRAVVHHFPATRDASDSRDSTKKAFETAFNETFGFSVVAHRKRLRNIIFLVLVGYRNTPGLARLMMLRAPASLTAATVRGSLMGRRAGLKFRKGLH